MHSKTNVISTYEFQFDLIEHGCSIGSAKDNKEEKQKITKETALNLIKYLILLNLFEL